MDEDRRTRFLVAPLLFSASLAWGIIHDGRWGLRTALGLTSETSLHPSEVGALLAAGGIGVFAVGCVIGTCSYVLLRFLFALVVCPVQSSWHHEMS